MIRSLVTGLPDGQPYKHRFECISALAVKTLAAVSNTDRHSGLFSFIAVGVISLSQLL